MMALGPSLRDLFHARERIAGTLHRTPLEPSPWLSTAAGCPVYLKLECWQRTRSFKARGAYNAVASLAETERARGLVTASAGNHGQGVALAAQAFGAPCTIFVPLNASELKVGRMRALGAEVRHLGANYDEAAEAAHEHAHSSGAHYVHAFSDPAVVAGQGTVGLEILEDLPEVADVLIPVGGGGLIAGVGLALRSGGEQVRIFGVQTPPASSMYESFRAGRAVTAGLGEHTIADGLHGGVEQVSYERARDVVHEMRLVDEGELPGAIRALYAQHGVVAEPSAAVGVALVLNGSLQLRGPAVVIVTGGNIDPRRLASFLSDG
ncbi:MAG TPA: threonine/serine dehydratase [Longimicrobiales bacterium]